MQIVNPLLPFFTFPIPIDITKIKELTGGIHTDMLRDNPTRVSIRKSKQINVQRTLGSWVSAHWGENLPTMECSGNIIDYPGQEGITALSLYILSGLYRLDKQPIGNLITSILGRITSTATLMGSTYRDLMERNFNTTSQMVNDGITTGISAVSLAQYIMRISQLKPTDMSPTYILHDNYIYQGYFTDFQFTRDIGQPRFIQYNFKLNIEWDSQNVLIDWLRNSSSMKQVVSVMGLV